MAAMYEIQGYAVVLTRVVFVTRVFEAAANGAQFNVQLDGGGLLRLKFADRAEAGLARDMLIKAIKAL